MLAAEIAKIGDVPLDVEWIFHLKNKLQEISFLLFKLFFVDLSASVAFLQNIESGFLRFGGFRHSNQPSNEKDQTEGDKSPENNHKDPSHSPPSPHHTWPHAVISPTVRRQSQITYAANSGEVAEKTWQ